jgi:hypothetical protein
MGLYSQFPTSYDILTRLAEGVDRIDSDWWNALAESLYQAQVALGADPSALGSAFASHTNLAQINTKLARMEYGRFRVSVPFENPTTVYFASGTTRFTDKTKMIVMLTRMPNDEGPNIAKYSRTSVVIQDNGISGTPDRFDMYHADWTGASGTTGTETWYYLAIEEDL